MLKSRMCKRNWVYTPNISMIVDNTCNMKNSSCLSTWEGTCKWEKKSTPSLAWNTTDSDDVVLGLLKNMWEYKE